MDRIRITGGKPLMGEVQIAGAKNAALTLMPASLLTAEPVTLTNVPRLSDIKTTNDLLGSLGTEVAAMADDTVMVLSSKNIDNLRADYEIVRKMRASNLVLGPLLARFHKAEVSLPGGCAIVRALWTCIFLVWKSWVLKLNCVMATFTRKPKVA